MILGLGFTIVTIKYYSHLYLVYKEISTLKGLSIITNQLLIMSYRMSFKYKVPKQIEVIHILKEITKISKLFFEKITSYFY